MSKSGARIVIVDDEIEIIRALQRYLVANGYNVLPAMSGEEAIEIFRQQRPDVMLLDLGLPDMSGLDVCRLIRVESTMPIIVLSVRDTEQDKVQALDLGADDYVAKPFGMDEILARIRVALRHIAQLPKGTEPQIQIGPLVVDVAQRRAYLNGRVLQLTPTEYGILKVFLNYRGRVVTRNMLLNEIWSADPSDTRDREHSLHVYISQLRQKIEPVSGQFHFLQTIPGVGYRFSDEEEVYSK
jgi:two-component system KDP operon response regulator KdpE